MASLRYTRGNLNLLRYTACDQFVKYDNHSNNYIVTIFDINYEKRKCGKLPGHYYK